MKLKRREFLASPAVAGLADVDIQVAEEPRFTEQEWKVRGPHWRAFEATWVDGVPPTGYWVMYGDVGVHFKLVDVWVVKRQPDEVFPDGWVPCMCVFHDKAEAEMVAKIRNELWPGVWKIHGPTRRTLRCFPGSN